MSIESPLDEPVHWVTEVKQGKHSLFDHNFFRFMDLLLELSESFLVKISLNKNSQFSKKSHSISDHSKNLIKIPHCPLLISGPDGLTSAKHLLGWFSQYPLQTWCLLLGIYQSGNTLLLNGESLPPVSVEFWWHEVLGYPCLYCHRPK